MENEGKGGGAEVPRRLLPHILQVIFAITLTQHTGLAGSERFKERVFDDK